METNNKGKPLFVIASVLAAVLIWFLANASTEVVIEVKDVPVEFLNAETVLAERGLMLVSGEDSTIDLTLKMTRGTVFNLDTEEIRIVADLANVASTGTQNIACRLILPRKISASDVRVESPTVLSAAVEVGELFSKQVEIRCELVGNVADGYLAGAVKVLPETLEVRGQQIDIMQVNYAKVELDVNNATSTIVALKDYTLYDFSDQPVTTGGLHPVTDQIQVTLPVMGVKEIPLNIEFVETPGARLDSVDWKLDVESITLCGDDALLNTISSITLDTLALEDLKASESRSYDLVIPEGLYNLSGVETVTLDIAANDIATSTFLVTSFDYVNLADTQTATVITTSRPVTLRGNRDDLSKIVAEELVAVADLSALPATDGLYTVRASVRVPNDPDVGIVGSFEITLRVESVE